MKEKIWIMIEKIVDYEKKNYGLRKKIILKCNYMFKRYKGNISSHNQEKNIL